jgi:hypothetical protein
VPWNGDISSRPWRPMKRWASIPRIALATIPPRFDRRRTQRGAIPSGGIVIAYPELWKNNNISPCEFRYTLRTAVPKWFVDRKPVRWVRMIALSSEDIATTDHHFSSMQQILIGLSVVCLLLGSSCCSGRTRLSMWDQQLEIRLMFVHAVYHAAESWKPEIS